MRRRPTIRSRTRALRLAFALGSVVAACGTSAGPRATGPAGIRYADVGYTADAGQDAAQPSGPLTSASHPGWKKQACLSCHGQTAPYPHKAETYTPPSCVSCHGYNGAPHTNHATAENVGCANCHGDVGHVATFQVPNDCVQCHFHPAQP